MKFFAIFSKRLSEATIACMVAMTQGNLIIMTLGHWTKALQVGTVAALATILFIIIDKEHIISLLSKKYNNKSFHQQCKAIRGGFLSLVQVEKMQIFNKFCKLAFLVPLY